MEVHWLYVKNPDNVEDFCWIPFDSTGLGENVINTGYVCTDPLGCIQIGSSDPVDITFWGILSGADAWNPQDTASPNPKKIYP